MYYTIKPSYMFSFALVFKAFSYIKLFY